FLLRRYVGPSSGHCQGKLDILFLLIPRIDRRAGRGLFDRLVAGDAAIKPSHVAEVVVDGQLRKPDLLDRQRTADGVYDRPRQYVLHERGLAFGVRLQQSIDLSFVIGQLFAGLLHADRDQVEDSLKLFAMGLGQLDLFAQAVELSLDLVDRDLQRI